MNNENKDSGSEIRRKIDAYLDAIDRALAAAGQNRTERRNITDDVETQIGEMLVKRAGDSPTVADVEAVLAELDPPEAYATSDAAPSDETTPPPPSPSPVVPAAPPRFSRTAIVGAAWAPFFLIAIPGFCLTHVQVVVEPASPPSGPSWVAIVAMVILGALGTTSPFGTTILGLISISQIRQSAGRFYGMALALFDALFYPLLALDVLIYLLFQGIATTLAAHRGQPISANTLAMIGYLSILVCVVADVAVAFGAWRAVAVPPHTAAKTAPEDPAAAAKRALLGKVALGICLGALVVGTMTVCASAKFQTSQIASTATYLFLLCEIAALILGLISFKDPLGKAAAITSGVLTVGMLLLMA